jgi:branched-chain amino acid transport system permease protein
MFAGAGAGFLINAVFLRPVYRQRLDRPSEFTLIVTFALGLVGSAAATAIFSANYRHFQGISSQSIDLAGIVSMSGDRLFACAVAILLIGGLLWLVNFTDVGRGWRALTQNRMGAEVVGVDVFRLSNLAFATSGALAAAAGAILVPLYLAYPTMGESVVVKSFVIVVLGGLGSIIGSLVGGLLLGLAEALGSVYISSGFTDLYGLAIMLLVLLFMPRGLFGVVQREL